MTVNNDTTLFCCLGQITDTHRRHVFISVAFLQYGHYILNGLAPLWETWTRQRQQEDASSTTDLPLVIHLIVGSATRDEMNQPYVRRYLSLFMADEVHVYRPETFKQQTFLLKHPPQLGMVNATLDHYNFNADPNQWLGFWSFLRNGILPPNTMQTADSASFQLRITFVQRKLNRKFLNLNTTILEIKQLLLLKHSMRPIMQEVVFE